MAYDGVTWNEATPTDNNQASTIDDYYRDLRKSVRSRMALEHIWPSSQVATNEAGLHKFITMSAQTSTPTLVYGTNTQEGCIFIDANNHLTFEDSVGSTYIIAKSGAGVAVAAGTGTLGALVYITSGGGAVLLSPGTSGHVLVSASNTAAPAWTAGYAGTDKVTAAVTGDRMEKGTLSLGAGATGNASFSTNFSDGNYILTIGQSGGGNEGIRIVSKAVGAASISNPSGNAATVNWIAVGT